MDFNIDNETFASAYMCLKEANDLLKDGLGNFNELDNSALNLINKKNITNYNSLNFMYKECNDLGKRMVNTIENLAKIDVDSAIFFEEFLGGYGTDLDLGLDLDVTHVPDLKSADGIKYTIDIIGEPDENTTIILVNAGSGGSYKPLDSFLEDDGIKKNNAIIIRFARGSENYNKNAYKLMEEVSDKYNIPIQNCTTAGFSAGGKYAVKQMADLVAAHPEIKQPIVMLVDAYEAGKKVDTEDLKALGKSGAILFSTQRNGVDQEYINHAEWSDYGIDFVKLSDNQCKVDKADPHKAVFTGYFESGLFNYQVGNRGFHIDTVTNRKGETIEMYENPRFYNPETGTWDYFDIENKSLNKSTESLVLNNSPVISLSTDEFESSEKFLSDFNDISENDKVDSIEIDKEIPEFKDKSDVDYSLTDTLISEFNDNTNDDNVKTVHTEVPLFYQSDYSNVNYGSGTLATHGCGIASLSMVASYYNDADIMPDELAKKYRGYGSSSGTDHGIYEKTADDLGLPFRERLHYCNGRDLETIIDALNEGCVVVAKAKKSSVFTDSGHYIVLTGVSEDGKIYVNVY